MILNRPRRLLSVCAMYQGTYAVSVAANIVSRARD
jgi:hypothetical protein